VKVAEEQKMKTQYLTLLYVFETDIKYTHKCIRIDTHAFWLTQVLCQTLGIEWYLNQSRYEKHGFETYFRYYCK